MPETEGTGRQTGETLKPFGIIPRTIREPDGTPKGYHWSSFDEAFERYPPLPPVI